MIISRQPADYNIRIYVFLLLLTFFSGGSYIYGQEPLSQSGNNIKAAEYNRLARIGLEEFKFDESLHYIALAQKEKENALSYCYLCHINLMQKGWEDAVKNGEQCVAMDPTIAPVYPDLFYAEINTRRWEKAQEMGDKVKQAYPDMDISADIAGIESSMADESRSDLFVSLFIILLTTAFATFVYRIFKNRTADISGDNRFTQLFLICCSVNLLLWAIFFAFSHWIWSQNPHVNYNEFTPVIAVTIYEHDGVESFVLYTMMFVNIVTTLLVSQLIKRGANKGLHIAICSVLFLLSCAFFYKIGFFPPVVYYPGSDQLLIVFVLGVLSSGLYALYSKYPRVAIAIILLLIVYAGLIPYTGSNPVDIELVLAPALRLLSGFKISEIYFQYDMLLSFLAALWLKCNFRPDTFVYLGNISFFLFFIGALVFSARFFKTKGLFIVFIVTLITMRVYAQGFDLPTVFQVTPLRLDLWLIVLLIAYYYGVRHWLLGLSLGLLIIFHRNLGLIYAIAYLELLVVLFFLELDLQFREKGKSYKLLAEIIKQHFKSYLVNILILSGAVGLCFILFHEFFSVSAVTYRKLGMGMLPISKTSFYWYVPIVLGTIVTYLYYCRKKIDSKYVTTGFFIVLLAIGNSMYFFGRSHENGILNICGILLFALFLFFDLLIFLHPSVPVNGKKGYINSRRVFMSLPVVFLLFSGYFYSNRILDKSKSQYENIKSANFVYPLLSVQAQIDVAAVKQVTNNSDKVFFLNFWTDFYYYYYCHNVPLGYFSPCYSWIYKKDLESFVQGLLNDGYYVVYERSGFMMYREYLLDLNYNRTEQQNNIVTIKKELVQLLLPETNSVYHVGINGQLGNTGIDRSALNTKDELTIELIIKPEGAQTPNATIFTDLNKTDRMTGTVLQANGAIPGQYSFGIGNGGQGVQNIAFALDEHKWNYLVIEVNKNSIKAYNNGKQIAVSAIDKPIERSNIQMIIGNSTEYNRQFKGVIRELKFSDGNLPESDIVATAQQLAGSLPQ